MLSPSLCPPSASRPPAYAAHTGPGGRPGNCRQPGDTGEPNHLPAEPAQIRLTRQGAQCRGHARGVSRSALGSPLPPRLADPLRSSDAPAASSGPDSSGWLALVPRLIQTSSSLFINPIPPYQTHHQEEGREGLATEVWGRDSLLCGVTRSSPHLHMPPVTHTVCVCPLPRAHRAGVPLDRRPAGCKRKEAGVVH